MTQRSILVLEKNEKIRATIRAAVRKSGFTYHELQGSENLFRFLNKHPVDVLLINSRQQGIGARSVCSLVRNDPQYRRFPLIILYGKPGRTSRLDYLKQGADDFVEMPFSPVQLMGIIKARLRPLANQSAQALSAIDQTQSPGRDGFTISPLDEKGSLEYVPPAAVFSKLFVFKESGILDLIVRKETRTIYFKNGDIIYAETMSKKDDIADFLARNRAGKGSGKELVAARAQAGGPKGDPNTYAGILKESKLMEPIDFAWWLRLYQVHMISNLFVKPQGVYQWQSLDIPEYATQTTLEPFYTPRVIFQGIRTIRDRWAHRELLPDYSSVPFLSPDFFERAKEYGLTEREIAVLRVINGKRTLKTIGEICHLSAPNIENFIYACQQLQLVAFDLESEDRIEESLDLSAPLELPDDDEAEIQVESSGEQTPETADSITQPATRETRSDAEPSTKRRSATESQPAFHPNVFTFSLKAGSLEETTVLETFRQCILHNFSGKIQYQYLGIEKNIFWKRGRIVVATSNDIDERLDNFLFRKDVITAEQRDQLRSNPPELIGSPNELIKRKFLTIDKVFVVVKEQIEAILLDLLVWNKGDYQCYPDEKPTTDSVPLDLAAPAVLIHALHQPDIAKIWTEHCAENTDYYRKFKQSSNLRGVKLSTLERRIINVLHDPVSVGAIIQQIDHAETEIKTSLLAMEMSGIIERCLPR